MLGDLDQMISDLHTLSIELARNPDATLASPARNATPQERAAAGRLLARMGQGTSPTSELEQWMMDPCGPKAGGASHGAVFQPVGNSLN
jgi:hypothetical protein